MAHPARRQTMSAQDFLAWEAGQAQRHEFIGGEVFAMAGAEDRHVTVALNLAMALRQHLAGTPCRTYMSDMKLFGPNSPTALIEEDDDSGYGLNPRIAASLMAGDYYVQVRHYDRSSGTGKYSVGVKKR